MKKITLNKKALILEEKTLSTLPYIWILFIVVILGLPAIGLMNYTNINNLSFIIGYNITLQQEMLQAHLFGFITETIIQWSAFSLAIITIILAFTYCRLTENKIALLIGLAVLFSGVIGIFPLVLQNSSIRNINDIENLNSFIWVISNTCCGLIIMIGMIWILNSSQNAIKTNLYLLSILFITCAYAFIYYAVYQIAIPQMWYKNIALARPYELVPLLIFLTISIYLYPKLYKLRPSILSNSIFYMSITQCTIALYMMLLSNFPYDNGYMFALMLKIVFYFIPLSCFLIMYTNSYHHVLKIKSILEKHKIHLKYLASHDVLTNLPNRRSFEDKILKEAAYSKRYNHKFGLLIIDIDKFKEINDRYGHYFGDKLIKSFAKRLKKASCKGNVIARIGGDEFAIIASEINSKSDLTKLAQRLLKTLNKPYSIENHTITSTASIGISLYPIDASSSERLFRNADIALYAAKKDGCNTFNLYQDQSNHMIIQ